MSDDKRYPQLITRYSYIFWIMVAFVVIGVLKAVLS